LKGHGFSFPGGNQERAGLDPLSESHTTMFEQATIPVQNESTFAEVKHAIDDAFTPAQAAVFLKTVGSARLRVRQFESVLAHGLLGSQAQKSYAALGDADRGQIREHYLRSVERVAPEIRQKFFRLYASY
jgi:hypothetical protein